MEISQRLTTEAAVIVGHKSADSANMERIFSAQANNIKTVPRPNEKVLELNPNHPVIKHLLHLVQNDPESEELKNTANLVTDLSFVISGFEIKDVSLLSNNVYKSL